MFKPTDLLWILASPMYLLIGTVRHEGSHLAVAILQGASVEKFVFWPTNGRWGYVTVSGSVTWMTFAAPYLVDLLTLFMFFVICMRVSGCRRWLWIDCCVVGLVSPIINSAYNYKNGLRGGGDVGRLLDALPGCVVHGWFSMLGMLIVLGAVVLFTKSTLSVEIRERGFLAGRSQLTKV